MVYPARFEVEPQTHIAAHTVTDTMSAIRILIADDHALVRESIRAILANQDDMEIVGTASDGNEAVQLALTHEPDVVVMDISMPTMDGLHATELIHRAKEDTRIVILSMHVNAALVQQALRMGARGYVLKRRATDELPEAIRTTLQGEVFLSPAIPPSYLPR